MPKTSRPRRTKTTAAADPGQAASSYTEIQQKKAVSDPESDRWALPSFMSETNGGGSAEQVPGFNIQRAITAGFETKRVAGPTTVLARPDGGFFSDVTPALPAPPRSAFFTAKPENVIGIDNRVMVPDTATTPWRCICHLEVEYEFGPVGFGTGFIIGPKAVLTAAHVIYSHTGGTHRKARNIRVIPGRNGTTAPYGYFVAGFDDCLIPQAWLQGTSTDPATAAADYAVIKFPDQPQHDGLASAERLGYFGLKCFSDAESEKKAEMLFVNNAGYPYEADKPYGTLWYNAGRIRTMGPTFIEYMVDTEGGQSGSPVYFYDEENKQRYVVAVHTTGDFVNRGLRITADIFDALKSWTGR